MRRYYPRREPRVLALEATRTSLAYLVVDHFQVRASGEDALAPNALPHVVRRLLRRERPSVVVLAGAPRRRGVHAETARAVPVVGVPRRRLPFPVLAHVYPELAAFAPTTRLRRLARVAITTLARTDLPPRTYAKTHRHASPARPARPP